MANRRGRKGRYSPGRGPHFPRPGASRPATTPALSSRPSPGPRSGAGRTPGRSGSGGCGCGSACHPLRSSGAGRTRPQARGRVRDEASERVRHRSSPGGRRCPRRAGSVLINELVDIGQGPAELRERLAACRPRPPGRGIRGSLGGRQRVSEEARPIRPDGSGPDSRSRRSAGWRGRRFTKSPLSRVSACVETPVTSRHADGRPCCGGQAGRAQGRPATPWLRHRAAASGAIFEEFGMRPPFTIDRMN